MTMTVREIHDDLLRDANGDATRAFELACECLWQTLQTSSFGMFRDLKLIAEEKRASGEEPPHL
jgi:hypothetical protein